MKMNEMLLALMFGAAVAVWRTKRTRLAWHVLRGQPMMYGIRLDGRPGQPLVSAAAKGTLRLDQCQMIHWTNRSELVHDVPGLTRLTLTP